MDEKSAHPIKRPLSFVENLALYLREYCACTSIHGVQFLGEKGRSVVERVWWSALLTTSFFICLFLTHKTYQKWERSPVIVTFATSQTPIWKVPFPAVTICPETKSDKLVFNLTEVYLKRRMKQQLTESENKNLHNMLLVCSSIFMFDNFESRNSYTDQRAIDFLIKVAPTMSETIINPKWLGKYYHPSSGLFAPLVTSDGICYTFNSLNWQDIYTESTYDYGNFNINGKISKVWNLDDGYSEDSDFDSVPRRTSLAGTEAGLTLLLHVRNENLDYICGSSVQGFKVTLHSPDELPLPSQDFFRVPLDKSLIAAVKPNMMTTSKELKSYKPEDRKCYFVTEKKLRFFQVYNQKNCLLECLTNYTLSTCRCVSFFMPRDNSTPICGTGSQDCVRAAKVDYLAQSTNLKRKGNEMNHKNKPSKVQHDNQDCLCQPSCTALDYEAETSQSDWRWSESIKILMMFDSKNATDQAAIENAAASMHMSSLTIYFKDMQFITSERNELYGSTDFWANCGGLLGLFTGFSFISLLEIVYFLTLRFFYNLRKHGRHHWSGADTLSTENNN